MKNDALSKLYKFLSTTVILILCFGAAGSAGFTVGIQRGPWLGLLFAVIVAVLCALIVLVVGTAVKSFEDKGGSK